MPPTGAELGHLVEERDQPVPQAGPRPWSGGTVGHAAEGTGAGH
jgi:hypothetical protein